MKILFVGNTAWSMWNFRREVMLALRDKGHEIVVIAPRDDHSDLLKENFIYEDLKTLSRKGKNPFRDISLVLELFSLYRKHQPDQIFQYTIKPNLYGSVAAFLCGRKPYSMVAGMGYVFTNISLLTIIVSVMYRIAGILSKKVLFLNDDDIADFKRLRMLPKNSIKPVLLPGEGIDMEYFNPSNNTPFRSRGEAVFVFVGRLLLEKGIREYLQAAKLLHTKYPNAVFRVIGPIDHGNPSAISESELQSYVASGAVQYLGAVRDVRPYLADADALILPTHYGEGLSRVCLEAFAMKKPIISTDNRGVKALVQDGFSGFTIPQATLDLLPNTIERFLQLDQHERSLLGENGYQIVAQGFSISKVITFYENLLNPVIYNQQTQQKQVTSEI